MLLLCLQGSLLPLGQETQWGQEWEESSVPADSLHGSGGMSVRDQAESHVAHIHGKRESKKNLGLWMVLILYVGIFFTP